MPVLADDYALLTQPLRHTAASEDAALKTAYLSARDTGVNTLLDSEIDANAERTRQWAEEKKTHRRFRMEVPGGAFTRKPGETITVRYPGFGLDAGKNGVIVMTENNSATDKQVLIVEVEV